MNENNSSEKARSPKKSTGEPFFGDINKPGRLRTGHLLSLLSVSHSTLYAGIASGRYPAADGKDGRRPYWLTQTVRPLLTK